MRRTNKRNYKKRKTRRRMRNKQKGGFMDFRRFLEFCRNGELIRAQESIGLLDPYVNILGFETAFSDACANGHLEVAEWLLQVKPDINISASNEDAFRMSCINGHLNVAKWLLQRKPDIDIAAIDGFAFNGACSRRHLDVVKWLASLNPDYKIINEDKPNWRCRNLKNIRDKKWEKNKNLVKLASGRSGDNMIFRMPTDVVRITASYL